MCIAYANGRIVLYNYTTNEKVLEHVLTEAFDEETEEKVTVTYIKYSSQCKRYQTWDNYRPRHVNNNVTICFNQKIFCNDKRILVLLEWYSKLRDIFVDHCRHVPLNKRQVNALKSFKRVRFIFVKMFHHTMNTAFDLCNYCIQFRFYSSFRSAFCFVFKLD